MASNSTAAGTYEIPFQPLDRLRWEHAKLLEGLHGLQIVPERGNPDVQGIVARATRILDALERHQEAEERFLFPLVSMPREAVFARLRGEHLKFVEESDRLLSMASSGRVDTFRGGVASLAADLRSHFAEEESDVFKIADTLLSPAQVDILRMKFACRESLGI